MYRIVSILTLLIGASSFIFGQGDTPCSEFNQLVKSTYNFRPSLLASDSEREKKSGAMDQVWQTAKARKNEVLPCLRTALESPDADPWFRYDGSNLLISLDPSDASKNLQIRNYANTNLEDVDLSMWVGVLARRGAEGFDTSAAGERWLSHLNPTYFLALHGGQKVDKLLGGIFIFGSMDEAYATPALLKIVNSSGHPGRETAISLLLMQATHEAIAGLRKLDTSTLSTNAQSLVRTHLTKPILFEPRAKPKTTREQFLNAFSDAAREDFATFLQLVAEVPDGEKDVVATMKPEDIPLIRKVRRVMISRANQHVAEYYVSFTQILMTMIWRPEMAR